MKAMVSHPTYNPTNIQPHLLPLDFPLGQTGYPLLSTYHEPGSEPCLTYPNNPERAPGFQTKEAGSVQAVSLAGSLS